MNNDDTMSEFSKIDEEQELGEKENIVDLVLGQGELNQNSLAQVLDGQAISEEGFDTFLSVEFYDHDTKTSEVVKGFKPNYATQSAFRNKIDDFYLAYLDRKLLKVEMFIS